MYMNHKNDLMFFPKNYIHNLSYLFMDEKVLIFILYYITQGQYKNC
jgi:hypothetical protein